MAGGLRPGDDLTPNGSCRRAKISLDERIRAVADGMKVPQAFLFVRPARVV